MLALLILGQMPDPSIKDILTGYDNNNGRSKKNYVCISKLGLYKMEINAWSRDSQYKSSELLTSVVFIDICINTKCTAAKI